MNAHSSEGEDSDATPTCFKTFCTSPFHHQSGAQRDNKISSSQSNAHVTNHESVPSLAESFSNFNKTYPEYSKYNHADIIREEEYYHLSRLNNVCLDYIGHGLFSYSQLQDHASTSSSHYVTVSELPLFNIACKNVNLKSHLLNGGMESELEFLMRKRILKFMNMDEDDYSMVFTANQSSAFKLLADAYPFRSSSNLLTVYDFDNEAVEEMVRSSMTKGARRVSAEFLWPSLEIQSTKLRKMIIRKKKKMGSGLFVFPLQSKMTGSRYSYRWMNLARDNGWHILLDATSLGAKDMETLGLSLFQPDFLICSFFKVFGDNPSGFSCLFIKKSVIHILDNSSRNMGIISLVPFETPSQEFSQEFSSTDDNRLRVMSLQLNNESTSEFIGEKQPQCSAEIESLNEGSRGSCSRRDEITCKALDHADKLGLVLITRRLKYLMNWLIHSLISLQQPHAGNYQPLVRIYGPQVKLDRGPVVAFNVLDWEGERVDPYLVQKLAARNNISLGVGVLKNICFAGDLAEEKKNTLELIGKTGKHGILVDIASLSFLSNFEDMYRLWVFVSRFLDADYVEKERWRYKSLNQSIIEV